MEGVGGEEGVPRDGVSLGHLVEHVASGREGAALGVRGDEVVGEEVVGGRSRGDDEGVDAARAFHVPVLCRRAERGEPWRRGRVGRVAGEGGDEEEMER